MLTTEDKKITADEKIKTVKVTGVAKRQRSFYLSDEAIGLLKQYADEGNFPSLNHALEALLMKQK